MNASRIPVLMYHRVGQAHDAREVKYCISPKDFEAHMLALAKAGYGAVDLKDFFDWLEGRAELREGSFLLTFDDGYRGIHDHAIPLLRELGFPATLFLVSGFIGGRDEWCTQSNPGGTTYPLLNRNHILEMDDQGFSMQAHTRHHADLRTLAEAALFDELEGSRRDLEDLLNKPIRYLAYPFGHHDDRVREAARRAGFEAAFSVQPGFNRLDVDRYRIRRLDVFGSDSPAMLIRKVRLGGNDGSPSGSVSYYFGRILARLAPRMST